MGDKGVFEQEHRVAMGSDFYWWLPVASAVSGPRADTHEDDDAFVVSVDCPGMQPSQIDVSVTPEFLTIKGERYIPKRSGLTELWRGRFERSFALPEGVDADAVQATMRDGVLQVTLPKRFAAKRFDGAAKEVDHVPEIQQEVPIEIKKDPNYAAYLADAGELQQKYAGHIVAYAGGRRIAEGRNAQELAERIPETYRQREMFITDVSPTPIQFRRPFRVRK